MPSDGNLSRSLSAALLLLLQHWCSSQSFSYSMGDWQPGTQMPSDVHPSNEVMIGGFVSVMLGSFFMETFKKQPQSLRTG